MTSGTGTVRVGIFVCWCFHVLVFSCVGVFCVLVFFVFVTWRCLTALLHYAPDDLDDAHGEGDDDKEDAQEDAGGSRAKQSAAMSGFWEALLRPLWQQIAEVEEPLGTKTGDAAAEGHHGAGRLKKKGSCFCIMQCVMHTSHPLTD